MRRLLVRSAFAACFTVVTLSMGAVPKSGAGGASADAWTIAARARAAKGIEQSGAIYDLWNHWEVADPLSISAALKSLSEDASIDPPSRALATAFASTARLQLGDGTEARALATQAGFASRWLVVGPFDHEGRSGFTPEIGPEIDRATLLAVSTTYDGKDHRGIHWRLLPGDATPYGVVDLAAAIRPTVGACAFATTFVAAPELENKKATQKAIEGSLWVGASGSVRVYWNGERVLDDAPERGLTFDRTATAVTIEPGWNRLLVKVCGLDRTPSFALRVADAKGAPIAGVRVDPDLRHGDEVTALSKKLSLPKTGKTGSKTDGKGGKTDGKGGKTDGKAGGKSGKAVTKVDETEQTDKTKKPALPTNQPEPKLPELKSKSDETPKNKGNGASGGGGGKPGDKSGDKLGDKLEEKAKGASKDLLAAVDDEPKSGPLVLSTPTTVGSPKSLFQTLLARADVASPSAADLEALARYMYDTSADDPTKHEARDLARRAAEAAPTVERWLLAGLLAEDRNQRRAFIDKAIALSPKGKPSVELLYAEAQLAASGPDSDAALPLYDQALAIDPDHLQSIIARADLLAGTGLKRVARKEIEHALGTRPRSRALLQRLASLLALDAPNEADEVRTRYEQLGLSGGDYLSARLDAAVDARSLVDARGVVSRWRFLDPTGDSPIKEGAGALEKLGDPDGAVALFTAGLEVSPDDPGLMIAMADVEGRRGKRDTQLKMYKQALARWPQITELRDYLEQAEPSKPREDEAFAEASEVFLKRRTLPANGFDTRILSQVTVTTVSPNGLSSRFHQIVFQPLTNEAAIKGKQYAFGFEADVETVTLRGAKIYRKDGKIDEATETGETKNDDPSVSMYTSGKIYYVLFPNLQPGDVVELRYRIEDVTPRNAFGDYFGEVSYLQNAEPTARIEYVLRAPKGRVLSIHTPANLKLAFSDEEKGDLRVLRWIGQDIGGQISEPQMPPWAETLGHVHVSTYKDWDALATWYWSLVKDQYVADDAVRAKVKELTKGLTKDADKVRAIYAFVVQQTRYVALEFGIHGFKPYRCAQIFARGFGDCKDKATLIVTMLNELGIEATPVLVRTNNRGDIETQPPSLAVFDHMIAYVPSLDLYLDGTAEDHGSTELPSMDRGALAVQINGGKAKIVHLPDPPATGSVRSLSVEVDFGKELSGSLDLSLDATGMFAPRMRARYRSASILSVKLAEDLPSDFGATEWSAVTPSSLDDLEKTPSIKAKGKATSVGRVDGDRRSLPVTTIGSLASLWAPLSTRKQDVRFWSTQTVDDHFTYRLPGSAKIERLPEAKKGSSTFGSYFLEVENAKGVVKLHAHFELAVTRVHPQDYAAFRAFLSDVDRALGQRLMVKP